MHKSILTLSLVFAVYFGTDMKAQDASVVRPADVTIVLVHGAFAESSSWGGVISRLTREGYNVLAVANPLRGVQTDSEYVSAIISTLKGPVVLVGHSYGGLVITDAANGHRNVKALVYVDGFAPEAGESAATLSARFPGSTLGAALAGPVPLADGGKDLYIRKEKFREQFAADVPEEQAILMFATQRPVKESALNEPAAHAAWKAIPSWFIYGSLDRNIMPAAFACMAKRAAAKEVVEVEGGSQVVMISHPEEVAQVIKRAAQSTWHERLAEEPSVSTISQHQDVNAHHKSFAPAPVVPLTNQPGARILVDSPLPEQLARGYVVIRYRAENARIIPVFGPAALDVSPRVGHLHITVDDSPWHWLDASGEPISINGLLPGPHKVLIELQNANHHALDKATVNFEIPQCQ